MNLRRIRALVGKEFHRLARNRGVIVMAFLLAAVALLTSTVGSAQPRMLGAAQIDTCWVDYWDDGPWLEHLRRNVPPELVDRVRFRSVGDIPTDRTGTLQYSRSEAAIQLRHEGDRWIAWFWYPGNDPAILRPLEDWFWAESRRFFHAQAVTAAPADRRQEVDRLVPPPVGDPANMWRELQRDYRERLLALVPNAAVIPEIDVERSSLHSVELGKALGVALVLFAIFFTAVCVMPSLTCEEREKGLLMAQCLSPATAIEMLAGKALTYIPLAILFAFTIGGLLQPAVWTDAFFCAVAAIAAVGAFGLGALIALLVRTQRSASLAAMGYALAVALVVFAGQRVGLGGLSNGLLEVHIPPLVVSALDGTSTAASWGQLGISGSIATSWLTAAFVVAWTRGWRP